MLLCVESERIDALKGLNTYVAANVGAWLPLMQAEAPWSVPLPDQWSELSNFQKLLVIKVFRPEKLVECIVEFIGEEMGSEYTEIPPLDLNEAFADSKNSTPLVFVMSTGADPMSNLLRFAEERNMAKRFHAISLGQGQGPIATALIQDQSRAGDWVCLQNCHLAKSWMPKLEKIVEAMPANPELHPDFRLWLSSMPAPYFPVPILHASIKLPISPFISLYLPISRALLPRAHPAGAAQG